MSPSGKATEASDVRTRLVPPSRRLLSFFSYYLHWYIGRHFHALRLANPGRFPTTNAPLIVFANHASWWDPETLVSCGQPVEVTDGKLHSVAEWNDQLAAALAATQDELAALAKLRDPARFETILSGRVGISGVYEAWKRFVAPLTGRVYEGSHGSIRHL